MIHINIMEINRIRSCSKIHYKDFAIIEIDVRYDNDALQRERMWGLQAKLLFIAMEVVKPKGDAAIIFAALSQPMGWINLLYYARGISAVAWIVVYVPLCLIRGMAEFLLILLLLSLFFWSLELPNQFGRLEDTLLKTFFRSFFGDFNPAEDVIDNRRFFKAFILSCLLNWRFLWPSP